MMDGRLLIEPAPDDRILCVMPHNLSRGEAVDAAAWLVMAAGISDEEFLMILKAAEYRLLGLIPNLPTSPEKAIPTMERKPDAVRSCATERRPATYTNVLVCRIRKGLRILDMLCDRWLQSGPDK